MTLLKKNIIYCTLASVACTVSVQLYVAQTNIFKKVSPKIDILMTHGPLHSLPPAQCFLKSNPTIPFSFCGHVHEEHGSTIYNGNHINVNASIMANVKNKFSPSNPPIVLDIPFSKISLESSL